MILRDYQQETVDNVDRIFADGKRFAGVVLPTGAGKSFVAMTEMLKNQNGNILQVGDKIMTYILKFNPTDKRIALTVSEPTTDSSAE